MQQGKNHLPTKNAKRHNTLRNIRLNKLTQLPDKRNGRDRLNVGHGRLMFKNFNTSVKIRL